MNNKIKIKLYCFILLLLFVFIGFLSVQNRTQGQFSLNKILKEQFNNKYQTKVEEVDNSLITIIESSCPYGDSCKWDAKQIPLIAIQDSKSHKLLSIFKIGFMNNSKTKQDTGNNIWLINVKYQNDGFKDFVFLTEWGIGYGGSGGLKGMVMFNKVNNNLIPVNGYFGKASKESSMILTDIQSGNTYSFPLVGDSFFTSYQDLNKDGKTDLLFARWEWILGKESHYVPRPWYLRVYELNNNKFEIAKWWNKGEEYKTQEDIGYETKDKSKLLELFSEINL